MITRVLPPILIALGLGCLPGVAMDEKTPGASGTTRPPPIPLTKLNVHQGAYEVKADTKIGGVSHPDALFVGWADIDLDKHFEWFEAEVAVDDKGPKDEACDFCIANEEDVLKKIEVKPGDAPVPVRVKVKGSSKLKISSGTLGLRSQSGRWLNARLVPDAAALLLWGGGQTAQPTAATPTMPTTAAPPVSKILSIDPDGLDDLAEQLAAQVKADPDWKLQIPLRVGIARFKLVPGDLDPDNAENVFENMAGSLIKTGVFRVVDSAELDKALEDLKIGATGHVDAEAAKKLGNIVDAHCILVGSISYDGSIVILNSRLINSKTGVATAASRIVLKKAKP